MSINDGLSEFSADVSDGLPSSWDWQQPVIIGVSGGADSMALLCSLAELSRREKSPSVAVAHVEYDLRPEASRDREFVVQHAEQLGFPCYWEKVCIQEASKVQQGGGTEAVARQLRYDFFSRLAFEIGARHVAVGHGDGGDNFASSSTRDCLRGVAGMAGSRSVNGYKNKETKPREFLDYNWTSLPTSPIIKCVLLGIFFAIIFWQKLKLVPIRLR